VLTATDGRGNTTSYGYNSTGLLTDPLNCCPRPRRRRCITPSHGYAYNADGNPTTITYPNGKNVTDGYNADQQLTSVTDWSNDKTSFGYNKDDVVTSETYPNGDTAAFTVSKDDLVTAITDKNSGGTTLAGFSYTRGKDSELTALTTTGSAISAPAQSYTYNPLGQLTGTGTGSYGYDNAADPTTLAAIAQTFNAGGQLATASGTIVTTMPAWRTASAAVAATSAPCSARSRVRSGWRSQTVAGRPARRALSAIPWPMVPIPRNAIGSPVSAIAHLSLAWATQLPVRYTTEAGPRQRTGTARCRCLRMRACHQLG
jgi:YD repeat-containing protein